MSLEEALNRQSDLLEKNNQLLERLLAAAPAAGTTTAASTETEDKPKTTRSTKAADKKTEAKAEAVTLDDVKPLFSSWLTEFPKNGDDDHPETAERKKVFKAWLDKIGAPNLKEVPADKLAAAKTWIEEQAAKGRLTEDAPEGDSDDDMLG